MTVQSQPGRALLFALFYVLVVSSSGYGQDTTQFDQIIEDYLKTFPDRMEIAIGIVDSGKVYRMGYQVSAGKVKRVDNSHRVYEIGSITKIFTSILLMDEVRRGRISLNDPIQKYLPVQMKQDSFQGHSVTIKNLITHTSGLSQMKLNGSFEDYLKYLRSFQLDYIPGKTWAYNNSAVALLGEFLAANNQCTYDDLLRKQLLVPLGMSHSFLNLDDFPDSLQVRSYDVGGRREPYWQMRFIKPAGGIKADLNDMIKVVMVNLEDPVADIQHIHDSHDPLGDSIRISGTNVTMGLGWWHYRPDAETRILYHEGSTYGQTAFLGFTRSRNRGIVILSNFSPAHAEMQSGKGINNPTGGLSKPTYLAFQILKK